MKTRFYCNLELEGCLAPEGGNKKTGIKCLVCHMSLCNNCKGDYWRYTYCPWCLKEQKDAFTADRAFAAVS